MSEKETSQLWIQVNFENKKNDVEYEYGFFNTFTYLFSLKKKQTKTF